MDVANRHDDSQTLRVCVDRSTPRAARLKRRLLPENVHASPLIEPRRSGKALGIDVKRDPCFAASEELAEGELQHCQAQAAATPPALHT